MELLSVSIRRDKRTEWTCRLSRCVDIRARNGVVVCPDASGYETGWVVKSHPQPNMMLLNKRTQYYHHHHHHHHHHNHQ
eukprot:15064532-Heterocapsa_arctica.AAC.1